MENNTKVIILSMKARNSSWFETKIKYKKYIEKRYEKINKETNNKETQS